jgi:hypothetical protein
MALLNDVFVAMKVEETFVGATTLHSAQDPDTILLYENRIDRKKLHVSANWERSGFRRARSNRKLFRTKGV